MLFINDRKEVAEENLSAQAQSEKECKSASVTATTTAAVEV